MSGTFTLRLKNVLDLTDDIGLNDYPIFDEDYRETLNQKIINRYWNSEIGQETISDFRRVLKMRMHEIMPLYNQYYLSEKMTFDPFETVNIKNFTLNKGTTETQGHSESGSTSEAKSRAVSSETPQHLLAATGDYATAAQDNISDTSADSMADETQTSVQDSQQDNSTTGTNGDKSTLLLQYRETFLNLDVQVLTDLADCFMLVLSNGDEFTERSYNDVYYWL